MDEVLELLCMHFIIDTDSLCFWTSERSLAPTHNGPNDQASSFAIHFYTYFTVTSVLQGTTYDTLSLSSAAQTEEGNKRTGNTPKDPTTMNPHTPVCYETRPTETGSQPT